LLFKGIPKAKNNPEIPRPMLNIGRLGHFLINQGPCGSPATGKNQVFSCKLL
jgi:hypothetical protein